MRDFIVCAYREKVEASGWPETCVSAEDKTAYVQNYLEQQGVKLRPEHIGEFVNSS